MKIIAHGIMNEKFHERIDIKIMISTPITSSLPPKIKIAFMYPYIAHNVDAILRKLRIKDPELAGRFVIDEENPDYVITSDLCMYGYRHCKKLRHYISHNPDSIFIFLAAECVEPDMNIFDYAVVRSTDMTNGDRITQRIPAFYEIITERQYKNDFCREDAEHILNNNPKFCNFLYSHAAKTRDIFFHMLSQYKPVESIGMHLNNTGTKSTRTSPDWLADSIHQKKNYKFSIAFENAAYRGYTTEKIITSLQAHTVPIYWGDSAVSDYINPKAFINCHDYSSFEEVIERVKEVDNNDDLWLDMVTQPWQTEKQRIRTLERVADYENFTHNIFSQDIRKARRRPDGMFGDICRRGFTGYVGDMPPLYIVVLRKIRNEIIRAVPRAKIAVKNFLHVK